MSQPEARAWWADVEHLRERLEERTAGDAAERPALRLVEAEARNPDAAPRMIAALETAAADAPRRPRARRTVQITGRPAEAPVLRRLVEVERRRPAAPAVARMASHPDRLAAWAVLLGVVLVLVATLSSQA